MATQGRELSAILREYSPARTPSSRSPGRYGRSVYGVTSPPRRLAHNERLACALYGSPGPPGISTETRVGAAVRPNLVASELSLALLETQQRLGRTQAVAKGTQNLRDENGRLMKRVIKLVKCISALVDAPDSDLHGSGPEGTLAETLARMFPDSFGDLVSERREEVEELFREEGDGGRIPLAAAHSAARKLGLSEAEAEAVVRRIQQQRAEAGKDSIERELHQLPNALAQRVAGIVQTAEACGASSMSTGEWSTIVRELEEQGSSALIAALQSVRTDNEVSDELSHAAAGQVVEAGTLLPPAVLQSLAAAVQRGNTDGASPRLLSELELVLAHVGAVPDPASVASLAAAVDAFVISAALPEGSDVAISRGLQDLATEAMKQSMRNVSPELAQRIAAVVQKAEMEGTSEELQREVEELQQEIEALRNKDELKGLSAALGALANDTDGEKGTGLTVPAGLSAVASAEAQRAAELLPSTLMQRLSMLVQRAEAEGASSELLSEVQSLRADVSALPGSESLAVLDGALTSLEVVAGGEEGGGPVVVSGALRDVSSSVVMTESTNLPARLAQRVARCVRRAEESGASPELLREVQELQTELTEMDQNEVGSVVVSLNVLEQACLQEEGTEIVVTRELRQVSASVPVQAVALITTIGPTTDGKVVDAVEALPNDLAHRLATVCQKAEVEGSSLQLQQEVEQLRQEIARLRNGQAVASVIAALTSVERGAGAKQGSKVHIPPALQDASAKQVEKAADTLPSVLTQRIAAATARAEADGCSEDLALEFEYLREATSAMPNQDDLVTVTAALDYLAEATRGPPGSTVAVPSALSTLSQAEMLKTVDKLPRSLAQRITAAALRAEAEGPSEDLARELETLRGELAAYPDQPGVGALAASLAALERAARGNEGSQIVLSSGLAAAAAREAEKAAHSLPSDMAQRVSAVVQRAEAEGASPEVFREVLELRQEIAAMPNADDVAALMPALQALEADAAGAPDTPIKAHSSLAAASTKGMECSVQQMPDGFAQRLAAALQKAGGHNDNAELLQELECLREEVRSVPNQQGLRPLAEELDRLADAAAGGAPVLPSSSLVSMASAEMETAVHELPPGLAQRLAAVLQRAESHGITPQLLSEMEELRDEIIAADRDPSGLVVAGLDAVMRQQGRTVDVPVGLSRATSSQLKGATDALPEEFAQRFAALVQLAEADSDSPELLDQIEQLHREVIRLPDQDALASVCASLEILHRSIAGKEKQHDVHLEEFLQAIDESVRKDTDQGRSGPKDLHDILSEDDLAGLREGDKEILRRLLSSRQADVQAKTKAEKVATAALTNDPSLAKVLGEDLRKITEEERRLIAEKAVEDRRHMLEEAQQKVQAAEEAEQCAVEQRDHLKDEVSLLRQQLVEEDQKLAQAAQQLTEADDKLVEADEKLVEVTQNFEKEMAEERRETAGQLAKVGGALEASQKRVAELETQLQELQEHERHELELKDQELEEKEEHSQELVAQVDRLEEELQHAQEELESQLEKLREELAAATEAIEEDEQQISEQLQTMEAQSEEIEQHKGRIEQQAETLQEQTMRLEDLDEQLRQHLESMAQQGEQLHAQQEQLSAKTSEGSILSARFAELEKKLEMANEEKLAAQLARTTADERAREMEETALQSKKQAGDANERAVLAEEACVEASTARDIATERARKAAASEADERKRVSELIAEMEEVKEALGPFARKDGDSGVSSPKAVRSLRHTLEELEQRADELKAEDAILRAKLSEEEARGAREHQRAEDEQQRASELQSEVDMLKDAASEARALNRAMERLKMINLELEQDLQQYQEQCERMDVELCDARAETSELVLKMEHMGQTQLTDTQVAEAFQLFLAAPPDEAVTPHAHKEEVGRIAEELDIDLAPEVLNALIERMGAEGEPVACDAFINDVNAILQKRELSLLLLLDCNDEYELMEVDDKLTPEQQCEAQQLFEQYDVNGREYVSKADARKIARTINVALPDEVLEEVLKTMAYDLGGRINYKAFVSNMNAALFRLAHTAPTLTEQQRKEAREWFGRFDPADLGVISPADAGHIIRAIGVSLAEEDKEKLMQGLVAENGGDISYGALVNGADRALTTRWIKGTGALLPGQEQRLDDTLRQYMGRYSELKDDLMECSRQLEKANQILRGSEDPRAALIQDLEEELKRERQLRNTQIKATNNTAAEHRAKAEEDIKDLRDALRNAQRERDHFESLYKSRAAILRQDLISYQLDPNLTHEKVSRSKLKTVAQDVNEQKAHVIRTLTEMVNLFDKRLKRTESRYKSLQGEMSSVEVRLTRVVEDGSMPVGSSFLGPCVEPLGSPRRPRSVSGSPLLSKSAELPSLLGPPSTPDRVLPPSKSIGDIPALFEPNVNAAEEPTVIDEQQNEEESDDGATTEEVQAEAEAIEKLRTKVTLIMANIELLERDKMIADKDLSFKGVTKDKGSLFNAGTLYDQRNERVRRGSVLDSSTAVTPRAWTQHRERVTDHIATPPSSYTPTTTAFPNG